jgi:hypothetical protein
MTISRVTYSNRADAQRSLDLKPGIDVNAVLDRALTTAAEKIDSQFHRQFYPSDDTRYFDWPAQGGEGGGQLAEPWRIYLDANDLLCMTSLVSGGVTIPLTAIFPGPANNPQQGRPYTRIELDRSQGYSFGNNGATPQMNIAIESTWGYTAAADPAGTLAASVGSSDTTVTTSDGSQIGPGDLMVLGYGRGPASGSLPYAAGIQPYQGERILITDVSAVATGLTQSGSGVTSASSSDQALTWTGDGDLNAGEVIVLDQENCLVEQIVGSVATVRRSWNGTTLSAHSNAPIYAFRQFSVLRAQLGTSASTYTEGAAVSKHRVPPLIRDLSIAEETGQLLQEGSGYARTVGSGEAAHPAPGIALADLWSEAHTAYARKVRHRGV